MGVQFPSHWTILMSNVRSDSFLQMFFAWRIQQTPSPSYLSSLWRICLLWKTKGWHGLWTRSCYSLPAYHVAFFVRKITRIHKSFWWIEPFIFRRKWIERFGALGPPVALVWAPPTALTFYSALYLVPKFTRPLWGTTGFSISKNNRSSPGERQKG